VAYTPFLEANTMKIRSPGVLQAKIVNESTTSNLWPLLGFVIFGIVVSLGQSNIPGSVAITYHWATCQSSFLDRLSSSRIPPSTFVAPEGDSGVAHVQVLHSEFWGVARQADRKRTVARPGDHGRL
jgi:hypothetical protein